MGDGGQLLGLAGRVLAVLLVLTSCAGAQTARTETAASRTPEPAVAVTERPAALEGPVLADTEGARLPAEYAAVIRAVYQALAAGDLAALGQLYAGDDWAGQAELLAVESVRRSVLDVLHMSPANLGEGYLYPGFSVDPTTGYHGYQTAFFLDYDPPHMPVGPLRWRGIAIPPAMPPA